MTYRSFQKNIQTFLFTYQVPFIAIFMQVRQFTSHCDVIKCVFLFMGFIANKVGTPKKTQKVQNGLMPL